MVNSILFNIIGILAVFIPVILLFTVGPETNTRRLIYGATGLLVAGIIGAVLYIISIDTLIDWNNPWQGRLARDVTAAMTEEIIRYPGILLAQYLGIKYISSDDTEVPVPSLLRLADDNFTTIKDPHGMGMFFGIGYGMGETFAFYIYPTMLEILEGTPSFAVGEELTRILFRITAVFAHTGLTYLSMAITSQKGFWRLTILLHVGSNVANRLFTEIGPNEYAILIFIVFTRSAIIAIAYFMLRPKIRYLSPAVLLFILVLVFLTIIMIATVVALLIGFITNRIIGPV